MSACLLNRPQVAQFERDGFVVADARIEGEDFAELSRWVEHVAKGAPEGNDRIRQPFLPKRPGWTEGVEGGENLFRFAVHPTVLDIVEQLIGPDLILIGSFMIAKRAGAGKRVPWHQDGYYLKENIRPNEAVTVWVAIDPVSRANGCVRFVRGSKSLGLLPTRKESVFGDEIEPESLPDGEIVDAVLAPGQFSLHDPFVVHGSEPNTNGPRRFGFSFNFIPAHCHYSRDRNSVGQSATEQPAETSTRPIWLVRGRKTNPLNDFQVGHDGLEALDSMAEEGRLRHAALV